MKRGTKVLSILLCVFIFTSMFTFTVGVFASGYQKFEPEDGKTLIIVGQDTREMDTYVNLPDVPDPAGFMCYTSLSQLEGMEKYYRGVWTSDGGAQDFQWWVKKYPGTVMQIGLYIKGMLNEIISGQYDVNINKLADILKASNKPVFLRIGYEFDGSWNAYEPALFVPAWKRIVDTFRKKNVNNVAFVWHSAAAAPSYTYNNYRLEDYYPGDAYVDWCAVSWFPWWQESDNAGAADRRDQMAAFSKAHGKPLMIGESAPKHYYQPYNPVNKDVSPWQGFYEKVFNWIEKNNVKAFCYINEDWQKLGMWVSGADGTDWGDTRIQLDPVVYSNWNHKVSESRFLNASSTLYQSIGYSPDPSVPLPAEPTPLPVPSPVAVSVQEGQSVKLNPMDYSESTGVYFGTTSRGEQIIGYTQNGDYIDYTLNVTSPGQYTVSYSAASAATTSWYNPTGAVGKVKLYIKPFGDKVWSFGRDLNNITQMPRTNTWDSGFSEISNSSPFDLWQGKLVLRVAVDLGDFNINWIQLKKVGSNPVVAPTSIPVTSSTMSTATPTPKPAVTPTFTVTPAVTSTSVPTEVPTQSPVVDGSEFMVDTQFIPSLLTPNQVISAKITAKNVSPAYYPGTKDVLVIVGLYDSNYTMVNVAYISKGIPYQENETLSAGFKLPSDLTGYKVRAFMWDGTDLKTSNMIPISNVKELTYRSINTPTLTPAGSPAPTIIPSPFVTPGDRLGKFEPQDGKTLLFIGQEQPAIRHYVDTTGDIPAGMMSYTSVNLLTGMESPVWYPSATDPNRIDRQDFFYWPDHYKNTCMQLGMWLCGTDEPNHEEHLSNILNGKYDDNLDHLANYIKQANCPVFLRVGYEVNGQFPPDKYREAFKYVYNRIKNIDHCDNVAFVWHVVPGYCFNGRDTHFQYYPGDEYVDWIAVSYFTDVVGEGGIGPYDYEYTLKNLKMITDYAHNHKKPIMIAESAPMKQFETTKGQASWDGWFSKIFDFIEQNDVKAFCYINTLWSDYGWEDATWGDSRIESNEYVKRQWLNKVNGSRFLHSSPDLFNIIGFTPDPAIQRIEYLNYTVGGDKYGVEEIDRNKVRIWYKPEKTVAKVIIHYKSVNMANMENVSGYYNTSKDRYELIVAPVFANQTLEYYFTCLETESGPQVDTQKYVYAKH